VARRTYEVRVRVAASDVTRLGERFIRAGSGGVEERSIAGNTWLVMYAGSRADAKRLADVARGEVVEVGEVSAGWDMRFADWLRPEAITARIQLAPLGDTSRVPRGMKRLWFEPSPVFGVGSHATTRLAARAVEAECRAHPGQALLDVGTGTGVLAMVGVVSGAGRALGLDVDRTSVASARKNARHNRLESRCRFSQRPLASVRTAQPLVVANIETRILVGLLPDLWRVTSRTLLVTGVLEEHTDDLLRSAAAAFSEKPKPLDRENGWVSYRIDR
jgi:ribosomal protein L11 methyltransferase